MFLNPITSSLTYLMTTPSMNKTSIDDVASNYSPLASTATRNHSETSKIVAARSMGMSLNPSISEPTVSDILCGKDKTYSKHEGNLRFRQLIQDYVEPYQAATSKQQKMQITKEIVRHLEMQWSARFLKLVGSEWQEISTQNARDKTSHALRFAAGKHHKGKLSRSASTASASARKSKLSSNHCRHVSVDTWTNSSQTCTSNHDSSSNSSVDSSFHHEQVHVLGGATVVQSLFDRQQAILLKMRKDLECGDSSSSTDAEVRAITECMTSAHVYTATPRTTPATAAPATEEREVEGTGEEEEEEFNTLRAEDLEKLFGDPLHVGDWDNVMDLTR
jgi:hypothetical protein